MAQQILKLDGKGCGTATASSCGTRKGLCEDLAPGLAKDSGAKELTANNAEWQRVVGTTTDLWARGMGRSGVRGTPLYITVSDIDVFKQIHSVLDLMPAIEQLKTTKCTLGLVMIACIRTGKEREWAIRALAGFANGSDIRVSGNSVRNLRNLCGGPKLYPHSDEKIVWTQLWAQPEVVARIALEEKSAELAEYIFSSHFNEFGIEKSQQLINFLVNENRWNALNFQCDGTRMLPDESIISFAGHIKSIADARAHRLLIKIAAIHPDRKKRMEAVEALNRDDCVFRPGSYNNGCYLISSAAQSKFFDTGTYAIDLATIRMMKLMQMTPSERRSVLRMNASNSFDCDKIYDAGFGPLLKEGVQPEIMRYGIAKMFQFWDEYAGYVCFPHGVHPVPEATELLRDYFERNFDRLVQNKEFDALEWLAKYEREEMREDRFLLVFPRKITIRVRSTHSDRAVEALAKHIDEMGVNAPVYRLLVARSSDPEIQIKCQLALGSGR